MALPVGIVTRTVTYGPETDFQGLPVTGTVTFQPSEDLTWAATGQGLHVAPITVALNGSGAGSVTLVCTDQPGLLNAAGAEITNWTYTRTMALTGTSNPSPAAVQLLIPTGVGALDLDTMIPLTNTAGVTVLSPPGPQRESPESAAAYGVAAAVLHGQRSTVIHAVGDSTTVGSNAWFAGLGRRIGLRAPGYTVLHRSYSEGGDSWNAPTVLQTGTINGGAERGCTLGGGVFVFSPYIAITDDLDLRVRAAAVDWTSGATQVLIAKWNTATAARSWSFNVSATGFLQLTTSADGATSLTTVTSTLVAPFTDGTPAWARVTLDADNGATGRTVTFYTSADGTTWTQLGTPVTTAGVTTIFQSAVPISVGARFVTATYTDKFAGTIYWVEARKGIGGETTCPVLLDSFDYASADETIYTWVGAPVILLVNGGIGGQKISYFTDAARVNQLHMNHGSDLFIVNDSHNESGVTNQDWTTLLASYVTTVKAHQPNTPVVVMGQNPVDPAVFSPNAVSKRYARHRATGTWAATQPGVYFVDAIKAFTDLPTQISGDGLHPTTSIAQPVGAGYEVWADTVYNQLFGTYL